MLAIHLLTVTLKVSLEVVVLEFGVRLEEIVLLYHAILAHISNEMPSTSHVIVMDKVDHLVRFEPVRAKLDVFCRFTHALAGAKKNCARLTKISHGCGVYSRTVP